MPPPIESSPQPVLETPVNPHKRPHSGSIIQPLPHPHIRASSAPTRVPITLPSIEHVTKHSQNASPNNQFSRDSRIPRIESRAPSPTLPAQPNSPRTSSTLQNERGYPLPTLSTQPDTISPSRTPLLILDRSKANNPTRAEQILAVQLACEFSEGYVRGKQHQFWALVTDQWQKQTGKQHKTMARLVDNFVKKIMKEFDERLDTARGPVTEEEIACDQWNKVLIEAGKHNEALERLTKNAEAVASRARRLGPRSQRKQPRKPPLGGREDESMPDAEGTSSLCSSPEPEPYQKQRNLADKFGLILDLYREELEGQKEERKLRDRRTERERERQEELALLHERHLILERQFREEAESRRRDHRAIYEELKAIRDTVRAMDEKVEAVLKAVAKSGVEATQEKLHSPLEAVTKG